jgi:hypothetical protein
MTIVALSAAMLLAACQDKRVKAIDTGITRDSVMSVISHDLKPGTGPDSLPNIYKRDRYLIAGKNYEVLYFTSNDEKQGKDSVPLSKLTPIVVLNNKVIGKGWGYWDSVSTANKIPVQKR